MLIERVYSATAASGAGPGPSSTVRPDPPSQSCWHFYTEQAWTHRNSGTGTTGEDLTDDDDGNDRDDDPTDRMRSKKSWGFVETIAGKTVSESRISRIRAWAMHYIYELEKVHGLAQMPPTWDRHAPLSWREDFEKRIEDVFVEVANCEGHWKARAIIIAIFSQWKKNKKKQNKLVGVDSKKEESEEPSNALGEPSNTLSSVALGKRRADGLPTGSRAVKRANQAQNAEPAPVFVDAL